MSVEACRARSVTHLTFSGAMTGYSQAFGFDGEIFPLLAGTLEDIFLTMSNRGSKEKRAQKKNARCQQLIESEHVLLLFTSLL